jgi:uncharacterized protein (DUF1778 family)
MPSVRKKPIVPCRLSDDYQRMPLTDADREVFLAALERKPRPSARLIEALKRHRRFLS